MLANLSTNRLVGQGLLTIVEKDAVESDGVISDLFVFLLLDR